MVASPALDQPAPRIGLRGWTRTMLRVAAMAVLLLICAPLHLLTRLIADSRIFARLFLTGIGWLAGMDIRVHGRPAPHALLLANHVSWMDIPALAQAAGSAFIAHDGLAGHPFLKWLCEMNDTVFIARHERTTVAGQVAEIRAALAGASRLTIFPEGTTSDGTATLPFKSALLSAIDPPPPGIAVQPVVLVYDEAPHVSWVGDEPGLDNFRRILARARSVRLDIHFLPPLAGPALVGRKAMAQAAQGAIRARLPA